MLADAKTHLVKNITLMRLPDYYYIENYRTPQVVNYLIFSDISGWLLATGTALIVAER